MKRIDFKIPIYNWDISVVTIYNSEDTDAYEQVLKEIEADEYSTNIALDNVRRNCVNGGDFWRDFDHRKGVIVLYPWSNEAWFWEIFNHEKRHLIDRIMEWAHINDTEAAAYLDGYVSREILTRKNELL